MDLAFLFGQLGGDGGYVGFERVKEVGVERGDEVVVVLLFGRVGECLPGELVDVPCVVELDVRESQRDGAAALGEEGNEEVGA